MLMVHPAHPAPPGVTPWAERETLTLSTAGVGGPNQKQANNFLGAIWEAILQLAGNEKEDLTSLYLLDSVTRHIHIL